MLHTNNRRFQHPTLTNGQVNQTELNREIRELTNVMNLMYLTDTYRTFHLNTKEYTFFSVPYGTFSKIDHILGNKANIHRYENLE